MFKARGADRLVIEGCWVDVYEKPWFEGKVHREQGPGRFSQSCGSMIVGPNAVVVHLGRRALLPRKIVPVFRETALSGKMKELEIVSAAGRKC